MKCDKCNGSGRKFVVERVVQGQDYGPKTEGHHEKCSWCGGNGEVFPFDMNEQEVLQILGKVGAVITNSHIILTSGKHSTAYFNKDAVYPHTAETSRLCRAIAERFADDNVQVVIAPVIGDIILSQWTAYHLTEMNGHKVFGVYAEKGERLLKRSKGPKGDRDIEVRQWISGLHLLEASGVLHDGEEVVIKEGCFVIKRGYDKLVAGKNVLVVKDILTTGGSAKKVIEATRAIGGNVIGLGALYNRGGVMSQDVGIVPKLIALVNIKLDAWNEVNCPLCKQNIPINMDVGKGREFLARKKA